MPVRRGHALCWWCQHFHIQEKVGLMDFICDAFPNGIPEDIFENDFDHREPYMGDNGIVFEKASLDTLKNRYLFKNVHHFQELVDLVDIMFQQFDARRAQGTMEPPLHPNKS